MNVSLVRLPGRCLLGLLLVSSVVAAHAGAAPATRQSDQRVIEAAPETRAATPRGEQTLRLAGPIDGPYTLDPALTRELQATILVRQIYRGLVRLNERLEPVPELAERIEIAADGMEYRFILRPNAVFHDGTPILADDVAYSLTRALDPDTAGGEAALLGGPTYLADIAGAADVIANRSDLLTGVSVLAEREVHIRLTAPRATFLMKLASVPAAIVDAADVTSDTEWWRTPNGSGPFTMTEWLPGERLTLAGFPGFARGAPPLTRVDIRLGSAAFFPFNLYEAGEIDVADVSLGTLDRVLDPSSAFREEITATTLFSVYYAAFRGDVAPMDDPHIRQAVRLGFDRARLVEVAYEGRLTAATGLLPPGMLGRDWPVSGGDYDLAAARAEIAASRYGSADLVPPVRVYTAGGGAVEAFRDVMWEDLGLRVEILAVDGAAFFDELARRSYPAYGLLWVADFPDPESFLGSLFAATSADNYIDYANPAFNKALDAAAREPDPARRADLYADANQRLIDDGLVLPFYHEVAYTAVRPSVHGLAVTPLGILGFESVWLEH